MNEILSQVYLEKRDALTRFLTARLGSREDAEDAVQEVFLKLNGVDQKKSIDNPSAFLFRSATNVAIDRIRTRQRAGAREKHWAEMNSQSVGIEPVVEQPSMERVIDGKARIAKIVEALQEFSPRVREVFVLHKFEGLTHKEVAERLGIAKSTVEKHMIAALKQLVRLKEEMDGG